jgi:hypothetical protein
MRIFLINKMEMYLSLQDVLVMSVSITGPLGTLIGFMWYHLDKRFDRLDTKLDRMSEEIRGRGT